jgi:Zn-dependent protease
MLITAVSQFRDNPPAFFAFLIATAVALIAGLSFHECSHAWSAHQLGDDTAKRAGRISLNPMRHLDPAGTVLMLVIGFGFAKPTPVNPYRLKHGPVAGRAMVAAAGPLSNFLIAALALIPLRLGLPTPPDFNHIADASGLELVGLGFTFLAFLNVLLGVFNLIPIPPLDGFDVLLGVLPVDARRQLEQLRQWGPAALFILLILPFATGGSINPIASIIEPILDFIFKLVG